MYDYDLVYGVRFILLQWHIIFSTSLSKKDVKYTLCGGSLLRLMDGLFHFCVSLERTFLTIKIWRKLDEGC